ncbi:MAG: glycoside hydrolase family 31 [Cellulomonas sp. 73-92]|uniref:glycoside hydrolase family 31 protein n=1 Tax=Cellulomonas sp. 73-92 TaxID=1895740 RepID=UPI000929A486|nr:TIM-barrel domain-containing protein [Cellulomonas sp. 73-92]OJV82209.1 MAG: glycoside hydrolase family 31 [Cellulomonas sp. 73-92]
MTQHDEPVRHRPTGDGHPYAASPDQRVPVLPQAGEPFSVGVVASPEVEAIACELAGPDGGLATVPMEPGAVTGADAAALAGGEGHLAEAQAAQARASGTWRATLPALPAGERGRYRFVATLRDGRVWTGPWHDVSAGAWSAAGGTLLVGGLPAERHPRVVPGSVAWWRDAEGVRRARFAFRLEPHEHVVGFGERFDAVDQRGRTPDVVVFEQYKSQGRFGRTYLPMPFAHVVGGDGWGFHVRSSRRSWFDVGACDAGRLVVEAAVGPDGRLEVDAWDGSVTDVLRGFLDDVGHPQELPSWVHELWASGNEWNTQAIATARMDTHRELDIPVGVVVVEAWSDELGITIFRDARYDVHDDGSPHRLGDFTFPGDGAWPDPRAWVDDMHARGIKVVLWQIPLLKTAGTIARDDQDWQPDETRQVLAEGAALAASGHVVLEADGSPYLNRAWWFPRALMPDLSTPAGRQAWTAYRRYLVDELGIDGFKTDGGEHAWGDDLRYADGRRGDEGNNLNPVHYARAFGDLLRSAGKAPVTFSRAGFTGSQAHGVFWAGDEDSTWEAFRSSLNAGISAAACGIVYWGWDIAGFSGPVPDPELYVRAVAASTFLPVMQYHSEFHHHRPPLRDRTPWNVAETAGDPTVVDAFRRYAQLRTRLLPYLTAQAAAAVRTSRPLMRGLFVDHPHDEAAWAHPHEFLLGDDVLVSPVTEPGVSRWSTYLPAGDWVDAWDGSRHGGGQVVDRPAPRDVVPVYLRAEAEAALRPLFAS